VPYDKYISIIYNLKDRRCFSSFLIILFGRYNRYPCNYYIRRLDRYYSRNRVPIIVPFFEYRLINNFKASIYINYIYYIKGGQYNFNYMSHFDYIRQDHAFIQAKFKDMPELKLNLRQYM
jgi:hypothetical protein